MDLLKIEELKQKLESEGAFEKRNKKTLPVNPKKIAFISRAGSDISKTVKKQISEIGISYENLFFSGKEEMAVKEIIMNLQDASNNDCDIILIAHKILDEDDISLFCNEDLIRSIAASKVTVISAIGHEIDWTLCDYAADVRVGNVEAAFKLISAL